MWNILQIYNVYSLSTICVISNSPWIANGQCNLVDTLLMRHIFNSISIQNYVITKGRVNYNHMQ
jgi:hypothetical protein